jgi:hypothetical protein
MVDDSELIPLIRETLEGPTLARRVAAKVLLEVLRDSAHGEQIVSELRDLLREYPIPPPRYHGECRF